MKERKEAHESKAMGVMRTTMKLKIQLAAVEIPAEGARIRSET